MPDDLRSRFRGFLGVCLALVLLQGTVELSFADERDSQPFFAFQNGLRAETSEQRVRLLKELGYDGIGSISPGNLAERFALYDEAGLSIFSVYLGLECTPDSHRLKAGAAEAISRLAGHGDTAVVELFIQGDRNDEAVRNQAIAGVREAARLAEKAGVKVVLYPHTGQFIDTVGRACDLARAVDCPNVGVMFNLCHFLRVEPDSNLRETLRRVAPLLWRVSISGAENEGTDWDALIQPLDAGEFSQAELLTVLDEIGYDGPVGLQCFGIRLPAEEHLGRSIKKWKDLQR